VGLWWGSVFVINVPIVAVGLVGIGVLVPESHDPGRPRLDPAGVLLSVVGLVLLVYGIIEAGQQSQWASPAALGFILAGVVVLAGFVWVEARTRHAALDVSWFGRPAFTAASLAIALATFTLSGMMLYGTYFLQFDRGYGPLGAGVLMLGMAAAMGLCAPLSARLVRRYGVRLVCATGLGVLASTYGWMARVDHTTPIAVPAVLLVLLGVGMAGVFAPATEAIMATLPRERAGAGAAVNSTVRQLAAALGIAGLGSVLSTSYRSRIDPALANVPAAARQAAGESIGATQALAHRLPDHGGGLLPSASDAFIQAMQTTAGASAGVMLLAVVIVLAWTPRRRAAPDSAQPTHAIHDRPPTGDVLRGGPR
jgi:MFS transporter, DHA2 family, multidrug resistance protein